MSSSFISFCPGCSDPCFPDFDDSQDNLPSIPVYQPLNRNLDRDPVDAMPGRIRRRFSKNSLAETQAPIQQKTLTIQKAVLKKRPGTPIPSEKVIIPQQASSSSHEPCPYHNWSKRYSTLLDLLNLEADASSEQSRKLVHWIKEDLAVLGSSSEKDRQYLSFYHLNICIKYQLFNNLDQWKSIINIMTPVDWLKSYYQNQDYFISIGINQEFALDMFNTIVKASDETVNSWFSDDTDIILSYIADDISALENIDKESYHRIASVIQAFQKQQTSTPNIG